MWYRVDTGKIPSLEHIQPASPILGFRHAEGRIFGIVKEQPWHSDNIIFGLVMNSARLSDLAVAEYEMGRKVTEFMWNNSSDRNFSVIGTALRAAGHFETCITATHRAVRHIDELR